VRWFGTTSGKVSVKSKNECAESLERTLDINVSRLPQPKAGADDSICNKQYILRGAVSVGTSVWRVVGMPTGATFTFSDSTKANSNFTVSQAGIYNLTFTEKNNQCAASDTVALFFRESPQLTLVSDNCNAVGTLYNLNIIVRGTAPYTIVSGVTGTFLGNTFISNSISEGTNYALTIKDSNGCSSNTLTGVKACPCLTRPAVLKTTSLVVCYGEKGQVQVDKTPILDPDDVGEFILHNGTTSTIGTILQRNKTGEFAFDSLKMQYERTYYIQNWAGNSTGGTVSISDRCFVASPNIPIVFKAKITASLKGDTVVCANNAAVLSFKTSSPDALTISFRNVKENITTNLNNARNNNIISVNPSLSTAYKLISVSDKNGCVGQIVDSVQVNIRPKLFGNAGADQTICVKTTQLIGTVPPQYNAFWRSLSGADIASQTSLSTGVSNLKNGKNDFVLTVTDSVCTGYRSFDTVAIFMPIIPNALDVSLEMFVGDTITSSLSENAPAGTYSVTRLTNPANGRFDVFNNGTFNYISDPKFAGIAKFKFMVCSEACNAVCDTGEVRILIKTKPFVPQLIEVTVPNAITPNDDGKNDVLIIDNIEKFPDAELTIFNRWGDVLYLNKNYKNTWGGTNQSGNPLPEGTYYYILRLKLNDGKILRGDMTILR
jgi:gliding motility-associated-like protein